jgi:hypothetical protein
MEETPPVRKIVRIDQVFAVGGTYDEPSNFTHAVNRNIQVLNDSDKNCTIKDIKFNVFSDNRYNAPPIYLAFIIAEVDVDLTPAPVLSKKEKRKAKKKKKK